MILKWQLPQLNEGRLFGGIVLYMGPRVGHCGGERSDPNNGRRMLNLPMGCLSSCVHGSPPTVGPTQTQLGLRGAAAYLKIKEGGGGGQGYVTYVQGSP